MNVCKTSGQQNIPTKISVEASSVRKCVGLGGRVGGILFSEYEILTVNKKIEDFSVRS